LGDTAYTILGVGDFDGDGRSDVLWENLANGAAGYWTTDASGAVTGFRQLGQADTRYSPAAIGDYNGNGFSDVLFRNGTTGDTGYWNISSGAVTEFHDLGLASAAYTIVPMRLS